MTKKAETAEPTPEPVPWVESQVWANAGVGPTEGGILRVLDQKPREQKDGFEEVPPEVQMWFRDRARLYPGGRDLGPNPAPGVARGSEPIHFLEYLSMQEGLPGSEAAELLAMFNTRTSQRELKTIGAEHPELAIALTSDPQFVALAEQLLAVKDDKRLLRKIARKAVSKNRRRIMVQ